MSSKRQSMQGTALRRLLLEQRGGVAAIMGLAIIPLFAVVGLAIDTGRGYMLKSKLSYAIDAAGLAGGRAFDTDMREEDIAMFFEANFPTGYMNSELLPDHPVVTFDDANNRITIEASATLPTAFMGVVGVQEITVSARTVIQRELRGMELVLVMDNTGSMRGNGGMAAMKPAATDLIDILYGDRETVPQFWVGVVPYAASVNIGTQHEDWLTGYNAADFLPTEWKGCVEARAFPNDSNDATPDVELWPPLRWATTCHQYQNPFWTQTGYVAVVKSSSQPYQPEQPHLPAGRAQRHADHRSSTTPPIPATWGRWLNGDNEWDPSGAGIRAQAGQRPLSERRHRPQSRLRPRDHAAGREQDHDPGRDRRHGALAPRRHHGEPRARLGLARAVAELARPVGRRPAGRAAARLRDAQHGEGHHPADRRQQRVVRLPWDHLPVGRERREPLHRHSREQCVPDQPDQLRNQFQTTWPGADYTAYGRLNEGRLGTTNQAAANAVLDDRMLDMCETMKAEGIIIYTMTFGPSPDADTQDAVRDLRDRARHVLQRAERHRSATGVRADRGRAERLAHRRVTARAAAVGEEPCA